MRGEADAIVIGSGINGLVAAAELAQAGGSVILLERNAEIGGFIATEERTLPGYLHDTFSSWHQQCVWAERYYNYHRSKDCSHADAIRRLTHRWLKIIHKMWLHRQPYNPELHHRNQLQHGS